MTSWRGVSGVLFLAVSIAATACGQEHPTVVPFDAARAFADLRDQVAIGPRPAGSPGAQATRDLIRTRLRQAGWRVESHDFVAQVPGRQPVPMTNLIGIREGERPARILIGAHYDTKDLSPLRFVGANDGASGVAVLLELARQLGASEAGPFTLWLVFFDGEEAFGRNITREDGLYGSSALAARMESDGELEQVRALILVDMVGDADLNLANDRGADPALRRLLEASARDLGCEDALDPRAVIQLVDDHTPFVERGVSRVLTMIDFQYGSRRTPGPLWHTEGDALEAVSEGSLNTVGRLLVETLRRIERFLLDAEPGTGSPGDEKGK